MLNRNSMFNIMSGSGISSINDEVGTLPTWRPGQDSSVPILASPQAPMLAIEDVTYTPLDESSYQIRLINILPPEGDSTLVRCTIGAVSLQSYSSKYHDFISECTSSGRKRVIDWNNAHNSPPGHDIIPTDAPDPASHRFTWGDYAALSYVWGDPSHTSSIILNDREIQVSTNLEIALRALSSRGEFQQRYKLWVDAICINQKDFLERSRQIGKMAMIYSDARAVIAWLGEEGERSGDAIKLIRYLDYVSQDGFGKGLEGILREDPGYLGTGVWMALHELMDRPYWYRLWVIQEVVLGASCLVLQCGNSRIDWPSFCRGICLLFDDLWTVKDALLDREGSIQSVGLQYKRPHIWTTVTLHLVNRDLWPLSRIADQGSQESMSFGRLLVLANASKAQDIRDKVYGLVGMMRDDISQNIIPDYRLPPSRVYAAVAKTFITVYGNLEPIREGNPWGQTASPSWAADWTWDGRNRHSRMTEAIWGPYWKAKGQPPVVRSAIPYHASGDRKMNISFSNADLFLTCRGFLLDEVDGLGAREYGYFDWLENTIDQPASETNAYGTFAALKEALWRALVKDRVAGGQKASARHSAILNLPSNFASAAAQWNRLGWDWLPRQGGYYFRWSGFRVANRNFRLVGKPLDTYFEETVPDNASEYDYTEVFSCADRTAKCRRFMTTKKGYIGWAPDNMYGNDHNQVRKGDQIAIIFGCSTPICIRPMAGYFQVIGEAYIQGLMEGEALRFLEERKCEETEFTFC
ncbi:HET-domain-containing protein [Stipitochalara longipes BDJ]|nr:HET-domain-containing protein [Stipitochalara longipes BDJ]